MPVDSQERRHATAGAMCWRAQKGRLEDPVILPLGRATLFAFRARRPMQSQPMPAIHQRQRAARKRAHERIEQVQPQLPRPEPRDLLTPLRVAALDLHDDREQFGQRGTGARWSRGSSRREQQVTAIGPMDLNIAATAPSQIDKDALGSLRRCQIRRYSCLATPVRTSPVQPAKHATGLFGQGRSPAKPIGPSIAGFAMQSWPLPMAAIY